VRGALGLGVTVFFLWLTLRDVHLGEVWAVLSASSLALWVLSAATATATFPLRARRWQAILTPLAGRLPIAPLWRATAIGMMVNNVFLARAGEPARAFALSRERKEITFAAAFASLVVDRLFDGVVVLALMVLATLDPRFPREATIFGATASGIATTAALLFAAILAVLYALLLAPALFARVAERVVGLVWARGASRVGALVTTFAGGLAVLRAPRLALEVAWWTLLHWLTNAAAFYLGFLALGLAAPLSAALFVQGLIVVAVALPGAPGFFGAFELAGKTGLGLYGVADAAAVSWAIGFHLLSFIPITVIGIWYVGRLNLRLRDIRQAAGAQTP
jgi:uncharacterized protein (TIRG00374 family)